MNPEPIGCLEAHPTPITIWLRGKPISLTAVARTQNIDRSYLSRIFSGKRDPGQMTVTQASKIAAALGMGLEDLIEAIYERERTLGRARAQCRIDREKRIGQEFRDDRATMRSGRIPAPRMPEAPAYAR